MRQLDATALSSPAKRVVFSTDPPYYDNIGYADSLTSFYVGCAEARNNIPELFSTLLVPKTQELVADTIPFKGSKKPAQEFFEAGFAKRSADSSGQDPDFPLLSFTHSNSPNLKTRKEKAASLMLRQDGKRCWRGFYARASRLPARGRCVANSRIAMIASGTNALASSIVLACRPRPETAPITTRKDFLSRSRRNFRTRCAICKKATLPPSIWRRPPSVLAWRSSLGTRRFSKPMARQCESEQHCR